jgi:4-amino-4-deoxy-L-arabinose transferase-like glycosyltransferase
LWLDESFLALNIINRPFAELRHSLEYGQAAPIGFLYAERLVVELLGTSEYALRLLPLLCGIASVFIFWRIAHHLLSPLGVVVALAIFSVSTPLIYYSTEVKQYSSDVAVALLLWWTFAGLETGLEQGRWHALALSGLLAVVAVWCSYPAVFVLGGVGMYWLLQAVRGRSRRALLVRGMIVVAGAGSFIVAYFTVHAVNEQAMRDLWRHAAAPLVPRSSADLAWLKAGAWTLSGLPLGQAAAGLVTLTVLVGALVLWRQHRRWFWWFAGALMLTWLASGLGKYPLASRLWLFLSPVVMLVAAAGVEEVWHRTRSRLPILAPALIVLLLAYPAMSAGHRVLYPREREEVRPLLEHIREGQQSGDVLYLYYSTDVAVRYYAARGLDFPGQVVVGVVGRGNWYAHERDLEQLHGRPRVWFLFSHVRSPNGVNEEALVLQHLDRLGTRLEVQRRTGASLYLYNLTATR